MTKISTPTSISTTSTLESTSTTRPRRTRPSPPWHPPPSSPKATSIHPLFVLLLLSLLPTQSTAFAAWFVDRRVSCFTDLLPGEIIMNNAVTNSDESRRWGIHVGVSPGDAAGKEYRVEFVVPSAAISTATATIREDVQYILELSGGSSPDGPNEPLLDPPAKFVESPDNGGVGCEGRRSYGKIGVSSNRGVNQDAVGRGAVVRFHEESAEGARLEIWGGWATGHEAVKLTDKVVVVYGKGIVDGSGVLTEESEGNPEAGQDDWEYADDEAEYQHEAELLTENQELLEKEFDQAEQDAIQALEEKRIETDGRAGDAVNDAEEEIVQSLEENRRDVEKAVEALRQAIQRDQFEKAKMGFNMDHARKEYSEMHKRFVKEKVSPVDQLIALQHHFQKQQREARKNAQQLNPTKNDPNAHNPDGLHQKEEKLEDLLTLEDKLQNTLQKLKTYDTAEHDKAQSQHQQPIPKEELEVDLYELKRKAKERLKHLHQKVSDTFDRAAVGVNEMFTEEQRKEILRKAEEWRATIEGDTGTIRGRGALSDGVQGRPLPPEGRHFLFVFFGMFGMVGLVRWMLEKRRRKVVKSKRSM